MGKTRLEAFSDGVMAILITIMVLELKVPHGADVAALRSMLPIFGSYVLSYVFLGIYWNNHHHMLHATRHINGAVLWANLHLLFWLSLVPVTTAWMGESRLASLPTATYGSVLFAAGVAYVVLERAIVAAEGADSTLGAAVGKDPKGQVSMAAYASAVPLAFLSAWLAVAIYVAVAALWLVPDPRIERRVAAG